MGVVVNRYNVLLEFGIVGDLDYNVIVSPLLGMEVPNRDGIYFRFLAKLNLNPLQTAGNGNDRTH